MMAWSSPRSPSPQGRPHGSPCSTSSSRASTKKGDSRPNGPSRSPARSASSHPRGLETRRQPHTPLAAQRPSMVAATPDPDLGHDDLVCRTDRCRTVPHSAKPLRPRPSPQAEAPEKYFSGVHKAVRRLPMTVWWAVATPCAANSSAPWPTAWSSTAGPPSGATARAWSARAPSSWRTISGGRASPACADALDHGGVSLRTGVLWSWRLGTAKAGERQHLLDLLEDLPAPGAGPAGLRRRLRQL